EDVGPNLVANPSTSNTASPLTPQLSNTTSAISINFFPDSCLEVTELVNSPEVRATTVIPCFFASNAISTATAFLPEVVAITITSPLRSEEHTSELQSPFDL